MICAPLPHDEPDRLAALRGLRLLDTPVDSRYERIVRLAQRHLAVPITLISLVDEHRQWFKARIGIEFSECDRAISFCAHVISARAALVVSDARQDERFADNPQVVGAPHLRFYAGVPLRALNGQPVGTLCVADTRPRDFSAEDLDALRDFAVLAEQEFARQHDHDLPERLRRSEERFDLLVSTSADGFFDHDHDTGRSFYAPQWKRMLGYEPDELPDNQLTFFNLLHPDDASIALRFACADEKNAGAVRPFVHEFRLRHRAGHWVWIESRGVALVTPGTGTIRRVLGFHADITRRRELETQMRMLDQAVNHIEEAISVINVDDDMTRAKILYINPAFTRITGYTPEEAIGKNPMFLLGKVPEPAQIAAARIAVKHARPFRAEIVNYRKDGTPFHVDWAISPVRDHLGQVTHWVSVRRDISGRKLTEAALQATNAQLVLARDAADSANRAKSQFLANMSHEIRTPLNGILGMAEVLAASPLTPDQRENLAIIQRGGDDLLTLINGILDLAKIEFGRAEIESRPLSPAELAHDLLALLAPKAKAKRLEFTCHLAPDLPRLVTGDPTRLRQILLNLLDNALKFTEAGSVRLEITNAAPGRLRFAVHDTGVGIPPEQKDRIFQLFCQGDDSSTRRHGGTGLGLAISQKLARLLGGEIQAVSMPEAGSMFELTLPLPAADGASPANAQATAPAVSYDGRLQGLRVLLAEDNPINRKVALAHLTRLGATPTAVVNGREAVEALRARSFDVVLMDVHMPELDGLDATRQIRALFPAELQPRIIALTASAMPADRAACLAAGMDGHLAKPFKVAELFEALLKQSRAPSTFPIASALSTSP